jgi:hypothetical protein
MQCKTENIDSRAVPQMVEKNRRRARRRKLPPPIRPLCIDTATRRQVRQIIALAAAAPIATAEFNAALATWPPPPRLEPLSLLMPFGYRVVFAIELSDGPPRRRLALSHPSDPPTLHMLVGLVALAEEFRVARGVDYASWSEAEGVRPAGSISPSPSEISPRATPLAPPGLRQGSAILAGGHPGLAAENRR